MPAAIVILQIANPEIKERISSTIIAESMDLSNKYEVSLINGQRDDLWELWIKRPDGTRVSRQLNGEMGELTEAVFRIRLRELIKTL